MSDLLSSWSRRRAAVAAEAAEAVTHEQPAPEQQAEDLTDAQMLEKLGLPNPMTLVQGDDFKPFLAQAVPAHLRKIALRRLWTSNPVLACLDGLNDYDDDYLTGSTGQGVLKTSYQVGKGMLAHLQEMERQKEARNTPPEARTEAPGDIEEPQTDDAQVAQAASQDPAPPSDPPTRAESATLSEPPADAAEGTTPRPRRMRFDFEDPTA